MLIKRLNNATFDVFWNKGWEYWARFKREPDGGLKFLGGRAMPTKLYQQFRSIINKKGKARQVEAATAVRVVDSRPDTARLLARFQQ